MSRALITEGYLTNIADAIRAKTGSSNAYTPAQMAEAIENIPQGADVESLSANANGTYTAPTGKAYSPVTVNVQPNLQTKTITQNGTVTPDQGYDGLSSVVVNVSGGTDIEPLSVTQNGTYTAPTGKAYSPVTVNVPGGGGSSGVYVGTEAPDASVGSDGDYYYQRIPSATGYASTPGSSSGTMLSGYEFTANSAATVIGLRGYVRNATTGSLILAASDGTVIKRIDNISFVTGWNYAEFDESVQLTPNMNYIVMISVNNAYLSYQSKSSVNFSALITGVQGRYGGLPGTVDTKNIYSADVVFESPYIVQKQYFKTSGTWGQIA